MSSIPTQIAIPVLHSLSSSLSLKYIRLQARCRRARSTYLGSESIVGRAPLARTAAWSQPAPRSRLLSAAFFRPAFHGGEDDTRARLFTLSRITLLATRAMRGDRARESNAVGQLTARRRRRGRYDLRNGCPLGNDVRLARPARFAALRPEKRRERERDRQTRERSSN